MGGLQIDVRVRQKIKEEKNRIGGSAESSLSGKSDKKNGTQAALQMLSKE
jgi:hypothetical protein